MEGRGADGDESEAENGSKLFGSIVSAIRCGTNDRVIRESLQSLSRSKLLSEKIVSVQETLDGETLRVLFSPVYLLLEEAESSVKSSKSTLLKWQLDAMLNLQRLFGKDHLILSDFFMDVASRLSESKRFGEALDYGGRALLMRINVLGLAHSKTAESHFCLGRLYHSLKSYEESRREFYICRGVYERLSNGESTLELAECDYAIGEMEVDALNFGAAFHLFYSCYCTRLSVLGAWDELTIKAKEMVEDYRQINGERHISSLEMRDRIEELRWKLEEAATAEYTISVFIGSIKDTANYSLTLTQLKTLVKTAVKYSISRGSGSVSPMNSPFKSPLEFHKSYRQQAEKLLGLLLNSNEDWGEWTVGSATSDTNSEFTEGEKGDVGLHGNNDDDYQFASDSDLPTVADCLENDDQSESKGGMDDSDRFSISKETKSGLVEEDKVEYSGGVIDSERVGTELALSHLLTEVTTDSSSYSIKQTNGSDSSDLKNKSSTTVISRKISKGISKAAPRKSSSGKARISVLSEITKVTSSRFSDSIEVTEDKGSSDGSEVLTFSMAGRTSLVCRDRSGVMVEVRVLENLAHTNDLPSTLNFSPNAKNGLSASSAKNESRASSAEHKSSQDLVTIPQPPPLPNSWPPVCLNLSVEDFLQSSHPENQSIDRHADGGKVTLKNQNSPTIKSWEPIENVEGTLWVKSSDVIVPWGDVFSDFESVFNREPERVVPHKSAAVAKKRPSILLASKDVVETKIPMPRQKQIELMLHRIGRDITISDLATAVKQLDTAIIYTSRQSLIQENLPTSEEVALITQLADKAKNIDPGHLQSKLGIAQFFIYEFSQVPDAAIRVRYIHEYHRLQEKPLMAWKNAAQTLLLASKEVKESPKLPFLFNAILRLSNAINSKTFQEGNGPNNFKLSDLSKLWQSRGLSGESVEQYIVKKLLENGSLSEALDLQRDLTLTEKAREVDFGKIKFEFDKIKDGLGIVERLRERETNPKLLEKIVSFITEVSPQILHCKSVISNAEESFKDLCKFLGEDPTSTKSSPSNIFGMLSDFSKVLSTAVSKSTAMSKHFTV